MTDYLLLQENNAGSMKNGAALLPNSTDGPSYRRESASDIFDILNCANGRMNALTAGNK